MQLKTDVVVSKMMRGSKAVHGYYFILLWPTFTLIHERCDSWRVQPVAVAEYCDSRHSEVMMCKAVPFTSQPRIGWSQGCGSGALGCCVTSMCKASLGLQG